MWKMAKVPSRIKLLTVIFLVHLLNEIEGESLGGEKLLETPEPRAGKHGKLLPNTVQ